MISHYFTKEGVEKVKKELQALKSKLKEIRSQKGEAADVGGNVWHDNPSFEELIRQENDLITQISEIEQLISDAQIIKDEKKDNRVGVGSLVTLLLNNKQNVTYKIVGMMESDPQKKYISYESPLGSAIMGAVAGEKRDFVIGDKKQIIQILKVE